MKRLFCILLLLAAGCTPVTVMRYNKVYPPTSSVEVFRTARPERPYTEIAELEVRSHKKAIESLVKKARELGADAIIVMGERTTIMALDQPFAYDPYGLGPGMGQIRTTWGVAIKYTDESG